MTAVDIHTCPSGECQEYTNPLGYEAPPRPVEVVIHTREDFESCERLRGLMSPYEDDLCAECRRAAREYANERSWIAYHYGGGYLARD